MSGGGGLLGGKRGRKGFVTNVNLVPFIDLFSTLIIFLLSTAVWDQLAVIQMNLGAQDKATVEAPKEQLKKVTSNVKITISDSYLEVFDEGKTEKVERPKDSKDAFDYTLVERFLDGIRQKYPEKTIVSLHAHNDMGSAVAATELALMAGAEQIGRAHV